MSITMPTKFEQNHLKTGAVNTMVVLFTDAGSGISHVASTTGMQQGSIFIHSHLVSVSSINEKLDLSTKSWGTSDVTIKLLNPRYVQGAAGEKDRLSEATDPEWGGTILDWALVNIYLLSGSTNTALTSDGILRFSGRIIQTPTVTEQTIIVKAISVEKEKHRMLPTTLVGSTYSSAPDKNLEQPIPIVYGEFNQNFWGDLVYTDGPFTGLGLAKALTTTEQKDPKLVIADHVVDAITSGAFLDMDSGIPFQGIGAGTVNDSGHGTIVGSHFYGQTFHLNDSVPSEYTNYTKVMVNKANVHDNNTGTKGILGDNTTDTGSGGILEGYAFFGINNDLSFRNTFWSVASGDNVPYIRVHFYYAEWTGIGAEVQGKTFHGDSAIQLYYGGTADNIGTTPGSGGTSLKFFLDIVGWESLTIGDRDDTTFAEEQPMALAVYVKVTPGDDSPALNTTELLFLSESYLEAVLAITVHPLVAWVECRGREYGSWITASGRSIDSQSSGDLIENPASIIESILRDELGVTTFDTDSFDFAYDAGTALANRQARLNITKSVSSEKVIKGLAEQSTFAFTWTAAGKAKLVPLHSSYWSGKDIDATIKWSHIKSGSLKLTKTKIYCNEVEVRSRYQGEANTYRDTDTITDSGSQSSYGSWRRRAGWPNIAGATQAYVSAKYVNSSDGLWSQPHLQVQFETLVFTYAHLEIGDAIELDSVSCDPQLKAYGESWSGIKLCVVGLQQNLSGTKITAVELFG